MNKRSFKAKVKKARKLSLELDQIYSDLYGVDGLENVPFRGVNAENLQDAITCFIRYGEGLVSVPNDNEDEIIEDLWFGYQEQLKG